MGSVLENRPYFLPFSVFTSRNYCHIWGDKKYNRHAQRSQRSPQPGIEGQSSIFSNKKSVLKSESIVLTSSFILAINEL